VLGVTRQRMLKLADSATDFPAAERTSTGSRVWPRVAVQAWAATHPDPGPVFVGPAIPSFGEHWPQQVERLRDLASNEAWALNHDSIDLDHLVLGMLHPHCPGAARTVLESFGVRAEPLRQAFIDSLGDPYDVKPGSVTLGLGTQRFFERAYVEAVVLADAEVASEHVLLAVTRGWEACSAMGWLECHGIGPDAVRRRVVEVTEGVELPEPPALLEPPPAPPRPPSSWETLELVPNPLGKDPRRRLPWGSMAFGVPEDRPLRVGMLRRQYFLDRDGYPVLTNDGRPVHIVVDEHGLPVLDEHGRQMLGPVEVPPGAQVTARHEPS
jgi:Clp amino terminal domain, pathogenicity island component